MDYDGLRPFVITTRLSISLPSSICGWLVIILEVLLVSLFILSIS